MLKGLKFKQAAACKSLIVALSISNIVPFMYGVTMWQWPGQYSSQSALASVRIKKCEFDPLHCNTEIWPTPRIFLITVQSDSAFVEILFCDSDKFLPSQCGGGLANVSLPCGPTLVCHKIVIRAVWLFSAQARAAHYGQYVNWTQRVQKVTQIKSARRHTAEGARAQWWGWPGPGREKPEDKLLLWFCDQQAAK